MATERQLRNRMQQLEQELRRSREESHRLEAEIRRQTDEQIRRMQSQAQEVFQRRLNETAEVYAQRVRQFQEEIVHQANAQLDQLRQEANAVNARILKAQQELEQCHAQLRREFDELKAQARRQDETFRQAAAESARQADQARQSAEATPHAFFCPQEFDVISSHIQELNDLVEMGMYQAAASNADCIALEFQLLQIKVERAFDEWMQAFEDYRQILRLLTQRLDLFESTPLDTSEGRFQMSPRELNFWSSGSYADLSERIRSAAGTFSDMDSRQILDYLNANAGTNRRAIFDLVTQARKWEDQLTAVINCIVSERTLSDQRVTIAQNVMDMLEKLNYQEETNQFAAPSDAAAGAPWYIAPKAEDPRNRYDLKLRLGTVNRLLLQILPLRQHGLAVRNEFYLTLDLRNTPDTNTELHLADVTLNRIRQLHPEIQVQFIPSAKDPARLISARERTASTPPNPQAQMQYLERKYQ